MAMVRLRRVGSRHEASIGDKYVGDVDDDHLRDYAANNLGAKFSVGAAGAARGGSVRDALALQIAARKNGLMERNPNLRPAEAFTQAKDAILKENPGLAARYRADCMSLNSR